MNLVCPELTRSTPDSLSEISAQAFGETHDDIQPIFLLSAGWRSGSTFVQRLICSDPRVLIWGEPLEDRLIVPRLHAMLASFTPHDGHIKYAIDSLRGELSEEWIANLNPGYCQLMRAHRAFFDTFLESGKHRQERPRWGMKSVRLTAHHALYLKLLYPRAKFIFLVRNPLDSWKSYRGRTWYGSYPDFKVDNIFKFCSHWRYLAASFLKGANPINAKLMRYEDIRNDDNLITELEMFLGVNINREVIDKRVGSSFGQHKSNHRWLDRVVIKQIAGKTARQLGYEI